jgi:hypothetical protein
MVILIAVLRQEWNSCERTEPCAKIRLISKRGLQKTSLKKLICFTCAVIWHRLAFSLQHKTIKKKDIIQLLI